MCIATKNFESESKFKSKGKNFRIPKRVPLSFVEDNSSFEDRNNGSCVKGNYTFKDYI